MDIFSKVRDLVQLLFSFLSSNKFLVIVLHRLSLPQQINSVWVLWFQLNTFWMESFVSCQILMGCICSRYLTLALVLSLFISLLVNFFIGYKYDISIFSFSIEIKYFLSIIPCAFQCFSAPLKSTLGNQKLLLHNSTLHLNHLTLKTTILLAFSEEAASQKWSTLVPVAWKLILSSIKY